MFHRKAFAFLVLTFFIMSLMAPVASADSIKNNLSKYNYKIQPTKTDLTKYKIQPKRADLTKYKIQPTKTDLTKYKIQPKRTDLTKYKIQPTKTDSNNLIYKPQTNKVVLPKTASAAKVVSLTALQEAAAYDPARSQGGTTPEAADDVKIVEAALAEEGLLSSKYAYDGSYGTTTIKAYKKWQESIGSASRYCDGIPGEKDLTKLGKKYGFTVDTSTASDSDEAKEVSNLKLSDKGIKFLTSHEGCPMKNGLVVMYNDPAGHCTIGYGHLIHYGPIDGRSSENPYKNGISKAEARDLFRKDVARYEDAVNSNVKVPLTQYQFDALVSFTYNIGIGGFKSSSALKELNKGHYDVVPNKMLLWNKPKVIIERRTDEANLFKTGSY